MLYTLLFSSQPKNPIILHFSWLVACCFLEGLPCCCPGLMAATARLCGRNLVKKKPRRITGMAARASMRVWRGCVGVEGWQADPLNKKMRFRSTRALCLWNVAGWGANWHCTFTAHILGCFCAVLACSAAVPLILAGSRRERKNLK